MKSVVITGSTKGIGLGLADAFLARGCQVVISGRKQLDVDRVVQALGKKYEINLVMSIACDVTDSSQIQALWDGAAARFGRVDIWINNAGVAQHPSPFWNLPPEQIASIIQTNITGAMLASRIAIQGMIVQKGGAIYNMEGLGSSGSRRVRGLSVYASSKAGLSYFDQVLIDELQGTPILFGILSPGMVLTDMLVNSRVTSSSEWEKTRRVFNILADKVETVTPWLVDQMLANQKHGRRIQWLTNKKVIWRFLSAPLVKRDLFSGL